VKDMRLSEEEKYQLVERYQNGESVSAICFQTGISKSTFYTWLRPYKSTYSNAGYTVSANEFIKMKQHIVKLEQKIEVLQEVPYPLL
jgi:putative transposase